jgi:hypothetical protein
LQDTAEFAEMKAILEHVPMGQAARTVGFVLSHNGTNMKCLLQALFVGLESLVMFEQWEATSRHHFRGRNLTAVIKEFLVMVKSLVKAGKINTREKWGYVIDVTQVGITLRRP